MELGAFSISLAVKDVEASKRFYEKFGFKVFAGDAAQELADHEKRRSRDRPLSRSFEKNILTFNPGWNSKRSEAGHFTDVATCSAS